MVSTKQVFAKGCVACPICVATAYKALVDIIDNIKISLIILEEKKKGERPNWILVKK